MQKILFPFIFVCCILGFMGCSNNDEVEPFSLSVNIPYSQGEKVVNIKDLKEKIARVSCNSQWLHAEIPDSFSASVLIKYDKNETTNSREGQVTITSVNDNAVLLKVIQDAYSAESSDELHDEVSTNIAY